MDSFIAHTLKTLESLGMSVSYPDIQHLTFADDGSRTVHMGFCSRFGSGESIEQNPKMKFMMIFMVFDFYIDTKYPELEGLSFSSKYKGIPHDNDLELMLAELFRISKLIRNALVHNHSSFKITESHLSVNYQFKNTGFRMKITHDALNYFYTSLVMFAKGDLGQGSYFTGVMRSIYNNILLGVSEFSDEFEERLKIPSGELKIKPYVRKIVMNPDYKIEDDQVKISIAEMNNPEWQGMDFYILHNGVDILVPIEALKSDLTICELDLMTNWKHNNLFPPLLKCTVNS